ncbi:MAG: endonuclease/exonuclease/phosphatase family protein [Ilumatobacteraceae bacterium]
MRLRWATWNLWAIGPSWIERSRLARQILEPLELDVICLQEVRRQASHDAAASLAADLGMFLGRGEPVAPQWWSGRVGEPISVDNVVLSRWPISDVSVELLPQEPDSAEHRGALFVRIDGPTPLRLVSTQLTSSPVASALRVAQVRALAMGLGERRRHDEVVLVAGDMNAEDDSDEMRLLCGHKTAPPTAGHVLMDMWRFAPPGAQSDTWDRGNPHVAASNEPSCRIDYLLAAPMPTGRLPRVEAVRRFGDHPIDGAWVSDHAGVAATIHLD